jgi:hypothetical protein
MLKRAVPAILTSLILASPALAGGQPSQLGLNWSNRSVVIVAPVNQYTINQTGDGNQAAIVTGEEINRRPKVHRLGVSGGTDLICSWSGGSRICTSY